MSEADALPNTYGRYWGLTTWNPQAPDVQCDVRRHWQDIDVLSECPPRIVAGWVIT